MTDKLKPNSPFYTLKKFANYKGIFITFFIVFVIPLLILQSVIIKQFYSPIMAYGISAILYLIMFLFINSFIILYSLSSGKKFSFAQVLKLTPSIIPVIILPTIIFAILITIAKSFFLIAPFLIFAFVPIVSMVQLYNKNVSLPEITDENKLFLKTSMGKTIIKNTFILSFISVIAIFILNIFFLKFFRFFEQGLPFSIYYILLSLLNSVAFFIVYISIVNMYSIYSFIIPNKLYEIVNNIFKEKKYTKRSTNKFSPKRHSHRKKAQKSDIFDFEEKDKTTKPKAKKERNRFIEDDSYNRFEDAKF